jgi:hypothetical protein
MAQEWRETNFRSSAKKGTGTEVVGQRAVSGDVQEAEVSFCRLDRILFSGGGRHRILRVEVSHISRDSGIGFCVSLDGKSRLGAWVFDCGY